MKPKITILDTVHSRADKNLRNAIYDALRFKDALWKRTPRGKVRKEITRSFIDKRNGLFLTGLLPRVEMYLKAKKVKYTVQSDLIKEVPKRLNLKKLTLRPYQKDALKSVVNTQRGVILSPTGSGKTVIIIALVSSFRHLKILFLCHTLDLLQQTKKEFKDNGIAASKIIKGGTTKKLQGKLVLSTIQSFSGIDASKYMDYFDVIIIDEAHHVNERDSQYGSILQRSIASIKIGFTATLPTDRKSKLSLEGLLGPALYELPIEEGVKLKVLAKPKVKLINIPYNASINAEKKFAAMYKKGIVENVIRNRKIITEVIKKWSKGKTTLIVVKEIAHGNTLLKMLKGVDIKAYYVQGKTESVTRDKTKQLLIDKKIDVVISTAVWREGINIPTLNCVINACGGRSEIMTLQAIGRGLRTTKDKSTVEIIDFLDPYRFLAEHSVIRVQIYNRENWL